MKIAVVCGGLSTERDVSITSGTNIARALRSRGHKVVLVDMFYGYKGEYTDASELFDMPQEDVRYHVSEEVPDTKKLLEESGGARLGENVIEICKAADIAFLALHGADGEDGRLQAALDLAGVRYTGSGYLGSAIAMNKELSKIQFRANGIATPEGVLISRADTVRTAPGFPCVVKPCSGGSSVGTSVVTCKEDFDAALELAFKYETDVVVEKFIKGRELTVGVMNYKAMPVIEIIPKEGFYDYKNKYQADFTKEVCPAEISAEDTERVQRLAEKVMKALMVEVYCRVDFIMDEKDGELYCLEANTLPGMTPTSLVPQMAAAQGMNFGELCEKIIAASMEKYI